MDYKDLLEIHEEFYDAIYADCLLWLLEGELGLYERH